MAVRGAVFASCIGRQRNPSLISLPSYFRTKFHGSSSHLPHSFNPYPQYRVGSNPYAAGLKFTVRSIQGATVDPVTPKKEGGEESPENWKIKMLYDGDCPLCMREVNMLRKRNERYKTIKFVDICSEDYTPEENQGLDYVTAMGRIHAILSDGTIVTDVEAFRRLYEHVGLGWVYAITKYEPIGKLADAVYGVWAKYRLPITGRPPLEEILEARKKKGEECKDTNSCKM